MISKLKAICHRPERGQLHVIIAEHDLLVEPFSVAALAEFYWECTPDERRQLETVTQITATDDHGQADYTSYQIYTAKGRWREMLVAVGADAVAPPPDVA